MTITSLTGVWPPNFGGGTYQLTQSGTGITGTFTPPSGSGTLAVTRTVQPSYPATSSVTLTLPLFVNGLIVTATFAGVVDANDPDVLWGGLTGAGSANALTLRR